MADLYLPVGYKKSSLTNDIKFIVHPKLKRNRRRLLRRKRSKLKYWKHRKQLKLNRKSQDLCDTISVFNITDMDYEDSSELYIKPIQEVAEWHKQQQILYWKSRAVSLEFENQMLHKYIANMYLDQVQKYNSYTEEDVKEDNRKSYHNVKKKEEKSKQKVWKTPNENIRNVKLDCLKELYGDMAPKISGMETAIQLNYDLFIEKHNCKPWPNIALRL